MPLANPTRLLTPLAVTASVLALLLAVPAGAGATEPATNGGLYPSESIVSQAGTAIGQLAAEAGQATGTISGALSNLTRDMIELLQRRVQSTLSPP